MGQRDTGTVSTNVEFSSRSKGSETAYGSEDHLNRIQFSTATETVWSGLFLTLNYVFMWYLFGILEGLEFFPDYVIP